MKRPPEGESAPKRDGAEGSPASPQAAGGQGEDMRQDRERLLEALHTFEHGKVVTASEAVALIRDGDTLATTGFVGIGFAENIAVAHRGALPRRGEGRPARRRQPARPHAGLRRRPGRRQGARPQPPRPRGPRQARDRRALGPRAEAAGARRRRPDRGLQPPAGRDHAPVPRHRRRQAGTADARRPRHVRRPAPRRRQAERARRARTSSR